MIVFHEGLIDCSGITADECSDAILAILEHGPAFKLKADLPTDTVHGSITVDHRSPPDAHKIIVEVYESDEAPVQGRETSLKRPGVMPTVSTLKTRLEKLGRSRTIAT